MRTILALWGGLCLAAAAQAQAAWPEYMPNLQRAVSESSVRAELPPGIAVAAPPAELPAARRRWSGLWHGWACRSYGCDVKVAVESVSAEAVTLTYALANLTLGQIGDRGEARFHGDELRMPLRAGGSVALRLRGDGDMEMASWNADGRLQAAGVLTQAPPPYQRAVEWIPTPWVENTKPVQLEMVVHRPPGAGPFPTLVFNHGSTGNGDRPEWFVHTWASPEVGQYFTAKGWQVVFPQRRGRGRSGGLYDEGFEPDRSRYACRQAISLPAIERAVADLDAVMAYLQTRADTDRTRMAIGGVSRGGILSVVYAGRLPQQFAGVVNFVGGWVGERCFDANVVNPALFRRGAAFARPQLWLYGDKDPFYSLTHSRANHEAFTAAGGKAKFMELPPVPGGNGHGIHTRPALWHATMDAYLLELGLR